MDKNLSPASPAPDADDLAECLDRRERISGALDDRAALILPAAPELRYGRDGELRYRPDAELYYLTGWRDPGAVAVLDPTDGEAPYRLFVAPRDPDVERWHGPGVGPEEAAGVFGADAVLPLDQLESHLAMAFGRLDRVYYRMGGGEATDRAVLGGLARNRKARQRGGVGLRAVSDPGQLLDPLRRVKSVREVERIRRAARMTVEAFEEARSAIRPGAGEWQVQAPLEAGFRSRGAAGPAFETIVAGGPNAVVLHYTRNSARLADGDFVLIDAGARMDMYAADVTRTWAVGGAIGGAAAEVHEIVIRAQRAAIAACRPGQSEQSVHAAATAVLLEGATALGLLPEEWATGGDPAEHRDIIPHRTSHWLGLEVHDVGDYATPSGPVPLEPGMVLTVEPGLYVPLDHPTAPDELKGVGVRIEDDALITQTDADVLTGALDRAAGGD